MNARWMSSAAIVGLAVITLVPASAQGSYHGRRAWTLQNNKIKVIVTPGGGHIASMTLTSGRGANLNPLWLPKWQSIEPSAWSKSNPKYGKPPGAPLLASILGHNICVDFFGAPSEEEKNAGVPVHGEAPCVTWKAGTRSANRLTYSTTLPKAQMRVSRTLSLGPGASTVWITESVENLSAFDRPFGWQQHVTFGQPFLQNGATFFDMPAGKSIVYTKKFSEGERLKRGEEFEWPEAPTSDGGTVSMREYPKGSKNSDFTASVLDPSKQWVWFTAINTQKGLLCGYIWPRKDWPWMGIWEENKFRDGAPWFNKEVARGMEFGTTPFPDSRREMVSLSKLLDTSTYRWIPASGKQTIGYGAFLAPIPPGTTGVTDVTLEGNTIKITLDGVDKTISLKVSK